MDTQDNVLNAKSNHIFCWPFKFDEHRWDEVTSHLLKSGSGADSRWSEKSMEYTDYAEKRQKSRTEKGEQIQVSQTERDVFRLRQYLSMSARNIFMKSASGKGDSPLCRVYQYEMDTERFKYLYYICCGKKEGGDGKDGKKEFYLPIADIELHLYRHGAGILLIQAANYSYGSVDDMKLINDKGRRIAIPAMAEKSADGFMLCPDRIGIKLFDLKKWSGNACRHCVNYRASDDASWINRMLGISQEENSRERISDYTIDASVTDFRRIARKYYDMDTERNKTGETDTAGDAARMAARTADFLYDLLDSSLESFGPERNDGFFRGNTAPRTDDRMFTVFLLRNDYLSDKIKELWDIGNPGYDNIQNLFYSIIYIDPEDSSCRDRQMRTDQLNQSVYRRWGGYGTLHSVTGYSMGCITSTSEGINDGVVRPVIALYTYVMSVVLAQKLGIEAYSEEAARMASGVSRAEKLSRDQNKRLVALQRKYITFKNQILILEASSQEQGIEIYHQMQRQLMIPEYREILSEQLENLYEAANTSMANFLAFFGILIAAAAVLIPEISLELFSCCTEVINFLFKAVVLAVVFYCFNKVFLLKRRSR